mmetsp:Transcript_154926/g.496506  ORF Transcript_154926/g.496506 Transcript_154926/m.496506 type:complete len:260 (-) Transcript_154926:451-1230(-)
MSQRFLGRTPGACRGVQHPTDEILPAGGDPREWILPPVRPPVQGLPVLVQKSRVHGRLEGRPACEQNVQHHTSRKDIHTDGAIPGRLAAQAEVQDLEQHAATSLCCRRLCEDHQILQLDIAVDQPQPVDVLQCLQQLPHKRSGRGLAPNLDRHDMIQQGAAQAFLHDEVQRRGVREELQVLHHIVVPQAEQLPHVSPELLGFLSLLSNLCQRLGLDPSFAETRGLLHRCGAKQGMVDLSNDFHGTRAPEHATAASAIEH